MIKTWQFYFGLLQTKGVGTMEQDFDRGMVPMVCDKKEKGCAYELHHYHCKVCGNQVNSDELRRDYHPCCSEACIKIWNRQYPPFMG